MMLRVPTRYASPATLTPPESGGPIRTRMRRSSCTMSMEAGTLIRVPFVTHATLTRMHILAEGLVSDSVVIVTAAILGDEHEKDFRNQI